MNLENIYSHPKSKKYQQGKPLTTHIENVAKKALHKYSGPSKYRKYIQLTAIFHDIGKANPNFQDYLFSKNKKTSQNKYKNHGYLSTITLLILIINNKDYFLSNFGQELLAIILILIAKHHGNLPNIEIETLNEEELNRVQGFFNKDINSAKKYINRVNKILKHFKYNLKELHLNSFKNQFCKNINKYLYEMINNQIKNQNRLEYFLLAQYIFSCVIEADKRDAGDNDKFLLKKELQKFNPEYFTKKLEDHYQSFRNKIYTEEQKSLNKVRTNIKNQCVQNVRKHIDIGERVFQIISPTGSGKTLTFLSVASEIKKHFDTKSFKLIYTIPFLSITDQITQECQKIFKEQKKIIYRIDSSGKTINEKDELLKENKAEDYDTIIDIDKQLILKDFAEKTFDHAFIITTFVKLFETITSNRNKDLLRFNNFSNAIIIIDEIQSLPPRTYTILIGILEKYAELFNSYIIIGSATVPIFEFPTNEDYLKKQDSIGREFNIKNIFTNFSKPINLLSQYKEIYKDKNFKRYKINYKRKEQTLKDLTPEILTQEKSTMCILNTKKSSHQLFNIIKEKKENVYLLNTMQTLKDRRKKLTIVKNLLKEKKLVYLISTQLIEAGIDISFPTVYRDLAPFPSIVQTAGRCNRNMENPIGKTIIVNLVNNNNRKYSKMVYTDLMDFTEQILNKTQGYINENELLKYQKLFFNNVKNKLEHGKYDLFTQFADGSNKHYLQHTIKYFEFERMSQFSLINNKEFNNYTVFIIQNKKDQQDWDNFVKLKDIGFSYSNKIKIQKIRYNLTNRTVSIPVYSSDNILKWLKEREVFGLSYIKPREDCGIEYTFEKGLTINSENQFI